MTRYEDLSPTLYADALSAANVVHHAIRPLWLNMPRIAGIAFPVQCTGGDNLMFHAAIHRAPAGSILVVNAAGDTFAVAGGNVCAVAKRRGIVGFIIDGVIRDVAEIRALQFPVFARGLSPIPGAKKGGGGLNVPIECGGARVEPGDMVVADEEGIVVLPHLQLESIRAKAQARAAKDAALSIEEWEAEHRARINTLLKEQGL